VPARLVFPVVRPVSYSDDLGDPRAQGGHPGNDILADKRAEVVAVEAGRIVVWTRSSSAGCMLYLYGASGTTYQYIHLNNDLTARNDNRGSCVPGVAYAPGLRDGQAVRAGELIGYVGDSGDADGLHAHLHFEIHPNDGRPVSPFRWLERAQHLAATGEEESSQAVVQRALL
jgi:murein DD-endopeptidase MepM/ murein hydrolase activator NlpD